MKKFELNAVVTQRIDLAPGLMVLRIAPESGPMPVFQSGQFAVVGLPASAPRTPLADPEEPGADPERFIRRAYSIASPSLPGEHLELFLTLVRSGELTPRLFALQPGAKVWLGPKITGLFTLAEVPANQDVVMVATGTGLAPYMSMLRTGITSNPNRRFAVLVGARHSWDLGYTAELTTLARICPNFIYLPIVSRPGEEPTAWGGAVGHVQSLWQGGALQRAFGKKPLAADTHVFLCGSPRMIEDVTTLLTAEGFTAHQKSRPGQVHAEKYW